ncbi:hypothetical protein MMC26_004908 [Xylographa opegraphella]|nr:hypothetical protein [Xylographa opegraphella]
MDVLSEQPLPRTPTPIAKVMEHIEGHISNAPYYSPPSNLAGDMTPPPSTQPLKAIYKTSSHLLPKATENTFASPPATFKSMSQSHQASKSGNLPSLDQIRDLPEGQLRELVSELLPAVSEARMAAAHAKLQHSLLSIEIAELAQRAAVEHEIMRRELEVLQASSPMLQSRTAFTTNTPTQAQMQSAFEAATKHNRILETDNALLNRRLKQAKRVIKHLDAKNVRVEEANEFLKQRIRQNREHIDAMRLSGTISLDNNPQSAYDVSAQRNQSTNPDATARNGSQDPFHTLLFAGQVLSGETTSVPSTPTHPRAMKTLHGHTRGAHSLSSLPMTPIRSRPMTADETISTPSNQLVPSYHISVSAPNTQFVSYADASRRSDRDSTISASDQDEAYTDEDVPASQASQAATNMLLQKPGTSSDKVSRQSVAEDRGSSQSKISGKISKPGYDVLKSGKKRPVVNELVGQPNSKKAKLLATVEQTGLGIAVWPSPGT